MGAWVPNGRSRMTALQLGDGSFQCETSELDTVQHTAEISLGLGRSIAIAGVSCEKSRKVPACAAWMATHTARGSRSS